MFRSYKKSEIKRLKNRNTYLDDPANSKKKKTLAAMLISSLLLLGTTFYLNDNFSNSYDSETYPDTANMNTTTVHNTSFSNAWGGSNITIDVDFEIYEEFQGYVNIDYRELNDNGDGEVNESYSTISKYISILEDGNYTESVKLYIPEYNENDSDYNSTYEGSQYIIRSWISKEPFGEPYSNIKDNPIELYWGPRITEYDNIFTTNEQTNISVKWENMNSNPNITDDGFYAVLELYNDTGTRFKRYTSDRLTSNNGTWNFSETPDVSSGEYYWKAYICKAIYVLFEGYEPVYSDIIAKDYSEEVYVIKEGVDIVYSRDPVFGGQAHELVAAWKFNGSDTYTIHAEFIQNQTDLGYTTNKIYANTSELISNKGYTRLYPWIPSPNNSDPNYTMNATYYYKVYITNSTDHIIYQDNKSTSLRWAPKIIQYEKKVQSGFETNITLKYYDIPQDENWNLTLRLLTYNGSDYIYENISSKSVKISSGNGTHTFNVQVPPILNLSNDYVWSGIIHYSDKLDDGYLGSDISDFLEIEKTVTIESYPNLMYPENTYYVNVSWNLTDSIKTPVNLSLALYYMDGNWWEALPWKNITNIYDKVGSNNFEINLGSNFETSQNYSWVAFLWYENATNTRGIDRKATNIAGLGLPDYPAVVYKGSTYMLNVSYDLNETQFVEYGIKNSDGEILWQKPLISFNLSDKENRPLYIPTASEGLIGENATIYVNAKGYNEIEINITAYNGPKIENAPIEISESNNYYVNVSWQNLANGTYNLSVILLHSGIHNYFEGMPWINHTITVAGEDNSTSTYNFSVDIPNIMSASTLYEWAATIGVGPTDNYQYTIGNDVINRVKLDENVSYFYAPDEVYRGANTEIEASYYFQPTPYSGVTDIEIKNQKLYIDGSEFAIRSVAYSPYQNGSNPATNSTVYPDESLIDSDLKTIKEMGANAIRIYDVRRPYILDLAQKHGLFVIVDKYVSPYTNFENDDNYYGNLTRDAREIQTLIDNYSKNPAVLMWTIGNEVIGNSNNRSQAYNYIKELAQFAQKYDNYRHPVTYAPRPDIINDYTNYNLSFLDIISTNFYSALSVPPSQDPLDTAYMNNHLDDISTWYPNHPIFVAETGWYTNGSSNFTEGNQSLYLEAHWNLIKNRDNVTGVSFFEYSDEWWKAGNPTQQDPNLEEHWGIVYENRTKKLAYYTLRDLWYFELEYGTENESHSLTKERINTTTAQNIKLYPYILDPQPGWNGSGQVGYYYIIDPNTGEKVKVQFIAYNTPKIEDAPDKVTYGNEYDINVSWENLDNGTFNLSVALMVNGSHIRPETLPWEDRILYNLDGTNSSGSRNITVDIPLNIDPEVYYEWIAWISRGPSDNESYKIGSDIVENVKAIAPELELIDPTKFVNISQTYEINISWHDLEPTGYYNLTLVFAQNGTNTTNHYWWPPLPIYNTTLYIDSNVNSTYSIKVNMTIPNHLDLTKTYEWAVSLYLDPQDNITNYISQDIESNVEAEGVSIIDASNITYRGSSAYPINVTYNVPTQHALSYGIKNASGQIHTISDIAINGQGYVQLYPYVSTDSSDNSLWFVNTSEYPESNWTTYVYSAPNISADTIIPGATSNVYVSWENINVSENHRLILDLLYYNGTHYLSTPFNKIYNDTIISTTDGDQTLEVLIPQRLDTTSNNYVWVAKINNTNYNYTLGSDIISVNIDGISIIDASDLGFLGTANIPINVSYNISAGKVISYGVKSTSGEILSISVNTTTDNRGYLQLYPYVPIDAPEQCMWFVNTSGYPESNWSFNTTILDIEYSKLLYTNSETKINISWQNIPNGTYNLNLGLYYYNGSEYLHWKYLPHESVEINISKDGLGNNYSKNDTYTFEIKLGNIDPNLVYFWAADLNSSSIIISRTISESIAFEGISIINVSEPIYSGALAELNLSYNFSSPQSITYGMRDANNNTVLINTTSSVLDGYTLGYIDINISIPSGAYWFANATGYNESYYPIYFIEAKLNVTPKTKPIGEIKSNSDYDINVSWHNLPNGTFNISLALMYYNGTNYLFWEGLSWVNETINISGGGLGNNYSNNDSILMDISTDEIDTTLEGYQWVSWIYIGAAEEDKTIARGNYSKIYTNGTGVTSTPYRIYRGSWVPINLSANLTQSYEILYGIKNQSNDILWMNSTTISSGKSANILYYYVPDPDDNWNLEGEIAYWFINGSVYPESNGTVEVYNAPNISAETIIPSQNTNVYISWAGLNSTESYTFILDLLNYNGSHYLETNVDRIINNTIIDAQSGNKVISVEIPSKFDTNLDYKWVARINYTNYNVLVGKDIVDATIDGIGIVDVSNITYRGGVLSINISMRDKVGPISYRLYDNPETEMVTENIESLENGTEDGSYKMIYQYIDDPRENWNTTLESQININITPTEILTSNVSVKNGIIMNITYANANPIQLNQIISVNVSWPQLSEINSTYANITIIITTEEGYWNEDWGLPQLFAENVDISSAGYTIFELQLPTKLDVRKNYSIHSKLYLGEFGDEKWDIASDSVEELQIFGVGLLNASDYAFINSAFFGINLSYKLKSLQTLSYGIEDESGNILFMNSTLSINGIDYIDELYSYIPDSISEGDKLYWFANVSGHPQTNSSFVAIQTPEIDNPPMNMEIGQEYSVKVNWTLLPAGLDYDISLGLFENSTLNTWRGLPEIQPAFVEVNDQDDRNDSYEFSFILNNINKSKTYMWVSWINLSNTEIIVGRHVVYNVDVDGGDITLDYAPGFVYRGNSYPINISSTKSYDQQVAFGIKDTDGNQIGDPNYITIPAGGYNHTYVWVPTASAGWDSINQQANWYVFDFSDMVYFESPFIASNAPNITAPTTLTTNEVVSVTVSWYNLSNESYEYWDSTYGDMKSFYDEPYFVYYELQQGDGTYWATVMDDTRAVKGSYPITSLAELTGSYKFGSVDVGPIDPSLDQRWIAYLDITYNSSGKIDITIGSDTQNVGASGASITDAPTTVYRGGIFPIELSYDFTGKNIDLEYGAKTKSGKELLANTLTGLNDQNTIKKYLTLPTRESGWNTPAEDGYFYLRWTEGTTTYEDRYWFSAYDGVKITSYPTEVWPSEVYPVEISWTNIPEGTYDLYLTLSDSETGDITDGEFIQKYRLPENIPSGLVTFNYYVPPSIDVAYSDYKFSAWIARVPEKDSLTDAPDISISGQEMYVDGEKFVSKSVCYSPFTRRLRPQDNEYVSEDVITSDLELIREMGANTIRIYDINLLHQYSYGSKTAADVLFERAKEKGLYVIAGIDVNGGSSSEYEGIIDNIITNYGDEPAFLMWGVGNEYVANSQNKQDAISLISDIKSYIDTVDSHPVTYSARQDIITDSQYDFSFLDIISTAAYSYFGGETRPENTDDLVNTVNTIKSIYTNKPIFISETGWHTLSSDLNHTQGHQAAYFEKHILKINQLVSEGTVLGISLFEFSDEWWKGVAEVSDEKGFHNYDSEEWLGIVKENRAKKVAFYSIQNLWTWKVAGHETEGSDVDAKGVSLTSSYIGYAGSANFVNISYDIDRDIEMYYGTIKVGSNVANSGAKVIEIDSGSGNISIYAFNPSYKYWGSWSDDEIKSGKIGYNFISYDLGSDTITVKDWFRLSRGVVIVDAPDTVTDPISGPPNNYEISVSWEHLPLDTTLNISTGLFYSENFLLTAEIFEYITINTNSHGTCGGHIFTLSVYPEDLEYSYETYYWGTSAYIGEKWAEWNGTHFVPEKSINIANDFKETTIVE